MTDIVRALMALRPGAEWTLSGNTLDGLDWHDKMQAPPTQAEIDAWSESPQDAAPVADDAAKIDRRRKEEAMQAATDPDPSKAKYPLLWSLIGKDVPDTGNAVADYHAAATWVIQQDRAWAVAKAEELASQG